ncbi:unnamed protein product [Urochloa humidicola]
MSWANSNNKGKAVAVKKEEVSSPTAMEVAPLPTIFQPLPVTLQENKAHHQLQLQAPWNNSSVAVTDDKSKVVVVDHEVVGSSPPSLAPGSMPADPAAPPEWQPIQFRDLMQHCVAALDAGNLAEVNTDLRIMSLCSLASPTGDPAQRVAFAFAEALARRALLATLPGLSWALGLHVAQAQQHPAAAPYAAAAAARRCFDALCPFLRVAASAANHAIVAAAAAAGKQHVHVVDLGGASPDQWLALLRLFAAAAAARPAGAAAAPPFVLRLSVVSEQEAFLSRAAAVLTQEAVRLRVPFVFNPVRSHIDRFSPADIAALGARPRCGGGEALVVTSTLQLHRLLADAATVELPAAPAAGPPRQVVITNCC